MTNQQQQSSGGSGSGPNKTTSLATNGTAQHNGTDIQNNKNNCSQGNVISGLNSCSNNGCSSNNTGGGNKNRICRDFIRGLCRRNHCRYPHVLSPELVVFCHDFQNSSCPRVNCKFLHYTLQEEEYYRKYGEFPQDHMQENGAPPPTCKDYLIFGSCRHRECFLTPTRLDREPPPQMWNDHPGYRINGNIDYRSCEEFSAIKRSSRDVLEGPPGFKRFREETDRIDLMVLIRRFEEEQVMLRRRVEANEIKIAELRASNEYLMAQNAQFRLNNVQQCSSVVNPVTVTQTTSQRQTSQVMGGVSIASVPVQATPIVSIATPQTQIIANSAPPLAIAANTSQGQQLAIAQQNITSLSNTSQPLAPPHAQQILGTSQITLAPAIAQGPSMGLTINTSQALAMSNATQPIISYPVMTHSILPH